MASGGSIRVGGSESVKTDDIDEGQENHSDDPFDDIYNNQDMLVSAGATTETSARHVPYISARVRPENDETSGDPMKNRYNPAPYDVEDPFRHCASIADRVSNLPVQSQRYFEEDERIHRSQPESDQENHSDDPSDDIYNNQDMLVSAGATTETSARHVPDISARVRPENDETSGDPMKNRYNPAPYDVEDPFRHCASIADRVSNLPVQSQRYFEEDERIHRSQPESDQENHSDDQSDDIYNNQDMLVSAGATTETSARHVPDISARVRPENDETSGDPMKNRYNPAPYDVEDPLRQLTSGTRDMSVRCQGVPHGGDEQNALCNTCSLDQFLNGLHQICRSLPFRNLLQALAEVLPSVYVNLWNAVKLCSDGLFSGAKLKLVPNVQDMRSKEGPRVMPLIKDQLPYRITKTCITCKRCSESAHNPDIILSKFSRSTGFQGALTPFFAPPDLQCSQPGCDGQTKIELKFENGYPPLIIAADLQHLHKRIPNSHLSKVVDLFGER
ncbi:uncharacterized protein LOC117326598 [Pecten maximus]|uniref:uncharacterized protein LOC117326598 n=1 Tax=Pecten maximus TaxID=6579 RepID=UPI00145807D8|nr:uncharacterized protein LOC117326598 [Pecten maximus]